MTPAGAVEPLEVALLGPWASVLAAHREPGRALCHQLAPRPGHVAGIWTSVTAVSNTSQ